MYDEGAAAYAEGVDSAPDSVRIKRAGVGRRAAAGGLQSATDGAAAEVVVSPVAEVTISREIEQGCDAEEGAIAAEEGEEEGEKEGAGEGEDPPALPAAEVEVGP